jgi:hypothetical protein
LGQLGLFSPAAGPAPTRAPEDEAGMEILDRLRALDPDELSPRAAHELLSELVRKLTPQP